MTAFILFGLFVLFFQVPHFLFKFAAEFFVDLDRRRTGGGQVEEFFIAALPSAALNLIAWGIACLAPGDFPAMNWPLIGSLFASDRAQAQIQSWVAQGEFRAEFTFLGSLLIASIASGAAYGAIEWAKRHDFTVGASWPRWLRLVVFGPLVPPLLLFYFVAEVIYRETVVPLWEWTSVPTYVFVRTKDGRLYWGLFSGYQKNPSAEIELIQLQEAMKINPLPVPKQRISGEKPFAQFEGPLFLKWSEVCDINVAPLSKLQQVIESYENEVEALERGSGSSTSSDTDLPSGESPS